MVENPYNLQELLKLPVPERLRLARRLIDSALEESALLQQSPNTELPFDGESALKGLLALAGRFSGGPGDTAERADEILKAEVDQRSGFTIKNKK